MSDKYQKFLLIFISSICLLSFSLKSQDFKFALKWGGNYNDWGYSVATDLNGNIQTIGSFLGTVDFNPGPNLNLGIGNSETTSDIFISKFDSSGNFIWVKTFGANSSDFGRDITVDNFGNVYAVGIYSGIVDFDPGTATYNLSGGTAFILKLSTNGDFIFAKSLNNCTTYEVKLDGLGNIIVGGTFYGTVDFSMGAGTNNLTSINSDAFILKIDPSGNLVWVKQFGGTGATVKVYSLAIDASNNIISGGWLVGTADFDPGAGTTFLTAGSDNFPGAFISKLDANGNYIWAVKYSLNNYTIAGQNNFFTVATDPAGNVYASGQANSTLDFDPGPGAFMLGTYGENYGFVTKLSSTGSFIWAKKLSGTTNKSVCSDINGYVYIIGYCGATVDLDPGTGVYSVSPGTGNGVNSCIIKLNPDGEFVSGSTTRPIPGSFGLVQSELVHVDAYGSILIIGIIQGTADFDPGPGTLQLTAAGSPAAVSDVFIMKFTQGPCSTLGLTLDSVSFVTCSSPGYLSASGFFGAVPYNYVWNTTPAMTSNNITVNTPGIYSVTITDDIGCTRSAAVIVNAPATTSGFDLDINLAHTSFVPGFNTMIYLNAINDGCIQTNGQVVLILNSSITLQSATPAPNIISGDSIFWDFSNLAFGSGNFMPYITVKTDSTTQLGTNLCLKTIITPISGDSDPTNNQKEFCYTVIGAFDPNDKTVYPVGNCEPKYVNRDEPLTYLIRFQNTGTAPAHHVFIIDSLSTSLNLNSVRILGQSHTPMITEVLPGNVLKFRFNNIMLPDSSTDAEGSHGYLIFEVLPNSNTPDNTLVSNSVGIYFDYNEPVLTNTVSNTITTQFPGNTSITQFGGTLSAASGADSYQWINCLTSQPILSATEQTYTPQENGLYAYWAVSNGCIDTSSCYQFWMIGFEEREEVSCDIFPNPVAEQLTIKFNGAYRNGKVEIYDILGRSVVETEISSQINNFTIPSFSSLYIVKISFDNQVMVYPIIRLP